MNERDRPHVTVIYQDAKSQPPTAVEVFFTVIGAITVLAIILLGVAR